MLGYKTQAKDYKEFLEAHPEKCDKAFMEKQIKIYEFLGELSESDLYMLFDSGAFNDIVKAYTELAAKQTGLTDRAHDLTGVLNGIFDMTGAKQALRAAGYPVKE